MDKIIVVRYAEIHLKGRNIAYFESALLKNLKKALKDIQCEVLKTRCRYIVRGYDVLYESEVIEKVRKVCGVHSLSPAYIVDGGLEKICETALLCADFSGTFKIETNRADKTFPMTSIEISREVGGYILDHKSDVKVDVKNPEHIVNIDMRESKKTYVYEQTIYGVGGLPSGTGGNAVVMLSGGIDSPVASYLLAKRGVNLQGVYFHSFPYTSDLAKEKVKTLANTLNEYTLNFKLNVVSFTQIQEAIHKHCDEEYMITLMRRFMMRISERIAVKTNCGAIITGESLGQVASQTMESINITNSVVALPVFRPLIGLDKLEIIKFAKEIGTYETSIMPYEDCCTVFLPDNPVIHPKMTKVLDEESKLDVEKLIDEAMEKIEVFSFE